MRWRVAVAAGLLAAVLLAGSALQAHTMRLCGAIIVPLEQTAEALSSGKGVSLDSIKAARENWHLSLPYFSALITHEWLDGVTEGLARAEGFLLCGEDSEALAEIRSLLILLTRITEYDKLSPRNIL